MTGKTLNNSSAGILILILPVALAVVILYKLWPLLLVLILLFALFRIWQNYQWQKWCAEVNPYFNQLIKENRGYLTPVDLSLKADLTARAAKTFLQNKAIDYGVAPKTIPDKGVVYYFPTASALGSILDDSEPEEESELSLNSYDAANDSERLSVRGIASLAKQEQARQQENQESASTTTTQKPTEESAKYAQEQADDATSSKPSSFGSDFDRDLETDAVTTQAAEAEAATETTSDRALIQADLAKRLDLNSSTVGRRKLDEDFSQWSQSKDPEGIGWKYISETKEFVPLDEN